MAHFSHSDVVDQISKAGWGRDFKNPEDAAKAMMSNEQQMSAFGIVEIIKRLNAIGEACGSSSRRSNDLSIKMPTNAAVWPQKNVGDFLYSGDLESGITKYVIVAKDDEHHCMMVVCNRFCLEYPSSVCFATEGDEFATAAEALKSAAEDDLEYYAKRTARAQEVLRAVSEQSDVSRFMDGIED